VRNDKPSQRAIVKAGFFHILPFLWIAFHFFLCFFIKRYTFSPRWFSVQLVFLMIIIGKEVIMAEEKIGEVVKFFAKPSVAAVKITKGELRIRDTIKIFGHTTDVTQAIDSMEVNNQKVDQAVAGDFIGIKVADRVRPGDEVFKVVP
jgi:putative protease